MICTLGGQRPAGVASAHHRKALVKSVGFSGRAQVAAPIAAAAAWEQSDFEEERQAKYAARAALMEKAAPAGLAKYETLIILKPTLTDEERDQELARFESFLHQEECRDVKAMVRGRQRMAYPIKGNWEGIYVLFSFIAKPSTTPKVQKLLSTPVSGKEDTILRHMTFRY